MVLVCYALACSDDLGKEGQTFQPAALKLLRVSSTRLTNGQQHIKVHQMVPVNPQFVHLLRRQIVLPREQANSITCAPAAARLLLWPLPLCLHAALPCDIR